MTTIEYLSLPLHKRIFQRIIAFFAAIPMFFANIFTKTIPQFFVGIYKKVSQVFFNIYLFFIDGDIKTKISFVLMGFGLFTRKSLLRGILYFLFQVAFIYFAVTIGISSVAKIGSFGYIAQTSYTDPVLGIEIYDYKDDSFMLLLNTIIFIILIVVYVVLWYNQLKDSVELQNLHRIGKTIKDKEIVKSLVGKNYHLVMLSIPPLGLIIFTIIPLIFMILVAFTNYSSQFQQPKELFDWVGSYNFKKLFPCIFRVVLIGGPLLPMKHLVLLSKRCFKEFFL